MPEPVRTSITPSTSKAMSASRTEGRLKPSCVAKSRSAGSREPTANSPEEINPWICLAIWRYSLWGSMDFKAQGIRGLDNWSDQLHNLHMEPERGSSQSGYA
jgi:hypothetical protein